MGGAPGNLPALTFTGFFSSDASEVNNHVLGSDGLLALQDAVVMDAVT